MSDARARFRALHQAGCFVIPNPWDIGGAQRLAKLGFPALASSSAAAAWALGKADGQLAVEEALDHLRMLCAATDLPVNADFEAGFAEDAQGVARNVTLAVGTGVAGLSIEDRQGPGLHDLDVAVERIRAAKGAIGATGEDVLLVARCEGYLSAARSWRRPSSGCRPMRRRAPTASMRRACASFPRSARSSRRSRPSR
jgi:2-methylisocitrate lyase-like PEP mutase family enzyme